MVDELLLSNDVKIYVVCVGLGEMFYTLCEDCFRDHTVVHRMNVYGLPVLSAMCEVCGHIDPLYVESLGR